jgi:NarL family two-component system response regulator LiaR
MSAEQALEEIRRAGAQRERPDVILVDLLMPGIGGVPAIRRLHERDPDVRIVVLTSSTAQAHIIGELRAGALSYLLKDATGDEITAAIR